MPMTAPVQAEPTATPSHASSARLEFVLRNVESENCILKTGSDEILVHTNNQIRKLANNRFRFMNVASVNSASPLPLSPPGTPSLASLSVAAARWHTCRNKF